MQYEPSCDSVKDRPRGEVTVSVAAGLVMEWEGVGRTGVMLGQDKVDSRDEARAVTA